jgi:cellulose synthase/poly-beta-1,6-N-acetylglucosamine synthase-like glycosyltransferase
VTALLPAPRAATSSAGHLRALPVIAPAAGPLGSRVHPHTTRPGDPPLGTAEWLAALPRRPAPWLALLPPALRLRTTVVAVDYAEREQLLAEHGAEVAHAVAAQLAGVLRAALPARRPTVTTPDGRVVGPVGAVRDTTVEAALRRLVDVVHAMDVHVGELRLRITPAVGWAAAPSRGPRRVPELAERALEAAHAARVRLDGVPRRWTPDVATRPGRLRHRPRRQVALTFALALGWPLLAIGLSALLGIRPADWMFLWVVLGLVVTSAGIWLETVLALPAVTPPPPAEDGGPSMTAVIPAHLPNEAATIVETLEAFLAVEYDRFEVILAYNTPLPLPVEAELAALAAADPRLTVVPVPFSTSKAQNVNAALHLATGDVVGVFDADHHPAPDSFARAAAWLANGADVVQGRCVVRNGGASRVSAVVAREFDVLYGVSHLGRARLHGYAVFGGSNGWFRADLLRRLRLHPDVLTEDIDISVRAVLERASTVYDPGMISTELAPVTPAAWWSQRTRWAQGWLQVSLRHLLTCLGSPRLTRRQRWGTAFLLGWREVAPWLTLAVVPLLVWSAWFDGTRGVPLNVPRLLLALAFTSLSGPFQTWVAYRTTPVAHRAPARQYVVYALASLLFYGELKNVVARVAQVREAVGERRWVTTPRSAATGRAVAGGTGTAAA